MNSPVPRIPCQKVPFGSRTKRRLRQLEESARKLSAGLTAPVSELEIPPGQELTIVPISRIPRNLIGLSQSFTAAILIPKSWNWIAPAQGALPSSPLATQGLSSKTEEIDQFTFGEVTIRFPAMEAYRRGQLVPLSFKQFRALEYLIHHSRRVISRDELLDAVWGYTCYPCTRTVDNHILQLRRKFELEPSRPRHIVTVQGAGYKFIP
jgi:DNA-binding winged helix-turn-helix (wHTH) protein